MRHSIGIIGGHGSHDTLVSRLKEITPSTVLDAPAGQGVLSQFLMDLGWDVTSADIDSSLFQLDKSRFHSIDLNRPLPFSDNSFDYIVCANGLHRLFAPEAAISEFSRILRPGGILFLNVNNYSSIFHRIRFLLYGSLDNYVNSQIAGQSIEAPEAHVRNAIMIPQIANALTSAGLEIQSIKPSAIRKIALYLYPLALAIKGVSIFLPQRKRNYVSLTSKNPPLLGHYILIEAMHKK